MSFKSHMVRPVVLPTNTHTISEDKKSLFLKSNLAKHDVNYTTVIGLETSADMSKSGAVIKTRSHSVEAKWDPTTELEAFLSRHPEIDNLRTPLSMIGEEMKNTIIKDLIMTEKQQEKLGKNNQRILDFVRGLILGLTCAKNQEYKQMVDSQAKMIKTLTDAAGRLTHGANTIDSAISSMKGNFDSSIADLNAHSSKLEQLVNSGNRPYQPSDVKTLSIPPPIKYSSESPTPRETVPSQVAPIQEEPELKDYPPMKLRVLSRAIIVNWTSEYTCQVKAADKKGPLNPQIINYLSCLKKFGFTKASSDQFRTDVFRAHRIEWENNVSDEEIWKSLYTAYLTEDEDPSEITGGVSISQASAQKGQSRGSAPDDESHFEEAASSVFG